MTMPAGQLMRVYTDTRFHDLTVVNDGTACLTVMQNLPGAAPKVVERVRTLEKSGCAEISESFAGRMATAYFDALAETALRRLETRMEARDFSDEQVVTPDRLLDLWEKAQAMEDGPEKTELMRQVREMAVCAESTAARIVNRLLD